MPDIWPIVTVLSLAVALASLAALRTLRKRHKAMKATLNRVASERDEYRWKLQHGERAHG